MNTNSNDMQVIENIYQELMISEFSRNIGLHGGTSGIALFLAYYDRIIHKKNDVNPKIMDILEYNIKCIDSGYRIHTICNGISGFGWLCEHLRKLGILRREEIEFLDEIDSYLYKMMIVDIQQGNYDFLHGALGVATYFLSRFDKKDISICLEKLLDELEKNEIPCENGAVKWMSVLNEETGEKGYNISLSHGMSSIAAFLIQLHKLNFNTERVDKLLNRIIMYILDQITYKEGSISYFPSYSKENNSENHYSRLGWCYGDLGIAHILWQAAIIIKNKELEIIAIRILHHNANRRDLQINAINDAGLCHGSSGVAHIYWNLFLHTGLQQFRATTDYWFQITMQMAKYVDGLAGFKTWRREDIGGPKNSTTLLDGISGIGLFLLTHLECSEVAWDECLMLS